MGDATGRAAEPRRLFLTFLGAGRYRQITYLPVEGQAEPKTTSRFVQVARLEALRHRGEPPDDAVVLTTELALKNNWQDSAVQVKADAPAAGNEARTPGLATTLEALGLEARAAMIPDGRDRAELWGIFDAIQSQVREGDRVYADITNGFRSLPVLMLLSLDYVVRAKGATLAELTYCAEQGEGAGGAGAPTIDLTPFLELRDWTAGLVQLRETGDTRALAEVARRYSTRLRKDLRADAPRELGQLPGELARLGDAILHCRAIELPKVAKRLAGLIDRAIEQSGRHDDFRPLALVLEELGRDIDAFVSASPDELLVHLTAQRAAAAWCMRYGLHMQGFTLVREALVTAVAELTRRRLGIGRGWSRLQADELLGALAAEAERRQRRKGDPPQARRLSPDELQRAIRGWLDEPGIGLSPDEALALLGTTFGLAGVRNGLNHAEPAGTGQLETWQTKALDLLDRAIAAFGDAPAGVAPVDGRRLLVLMSHPLLDEQEADARKGWQVTDIVETPPALTAAWKDVPPEGELPADTLSAVTDWLDAAARPGDFLLVQGEPGLTHAVVNAAAARGLRPVYATTRRDAVEEIQPDGSVRTVRVFRHVRLREYPV